MGWTWIYQDGTGDPVASVPPEAALEAFDSQADAETWLGENWRSLLEHGVDAVTLYDGEAVAYGPMSLHPAS